MAYNAWNVRCEIYLEWVVALIVGAATVSVWRGSWLFLDVLLLPQHPLASAVASLVLGTIGFVILCGLQPTLASCARVHNHHRALWLADAIYCYLTSWVVVLYWRGCWYAWDQAFGNGMALAAPDYPPMSAVVSHTTGVAVLLLLGGLRNLSAPPMIVSSDGVAPIFGAGATAGIGHLNPMLRWRRPPAVQSAEDWHGAVGVPFFKRHEVEQAEGHVLESAGLA